MFSASVVVSDIKDMLFQKLLPFETIKLLLSSSIWGHRGAFSGTRGDCPVKATLYETLRRAKLPS